MPLRYSPTVRQLLPTRRLLAGALIAGAAAVAVPAAADASTCSLNVLGQMQVEDTSGSQQLRITRSGQFIGVGDGPNQLSFCAGPSAFANVTNTNQIIVRGTASSGGGGLQLDLSNGPLAPGEAVEPDGNNEIEVLVDPGNLSTPSLDIIGTPGADTIKVSAGGGVMFGNDTDVDVRARGAGLVSINGGLGNDFITGRGSFPATTQKPANTPLLLHGGAGNDTLIDGLSVDQLFGDGNDDTLFSVDGLFDRNSGGTGFDRATLDASDTVIDNSVEQTTFGAVGRLHLAPAIVKVKPGKVARMSMSWTHPKAWSALRSIDWRVFDGGKSLGAITVRPATGRLGAHGGAKLVRERSGVSHSGKTVTAKLAVRLPKALAGAQLRVDVEATDAKGHRQIEPGAGLIRVVR